MNKKKFVKFFLFFFTICLIIFAIIIKVQKNNEEKEVKISSEDISYNSNIIDGVFVGADRIAANGDTANKIGTYSLAVLANYHKVPFYVAAPLSTVDFESDSGLDIPVENRSPKEVTRVKDFQFTIEDIDVTTPAFDVTPAELIHGIITEKGVAKYPYKDSLKEQRNEN